MDAEAILRELSYPEGLPREALKAASAQRAEILPLFLDEIQTYLALEPAARKSQHHCFSFSICSVSGGKRLLIDPWHVC
jgi:hypothetical protein